MSGDIAQRQPLAIPWISANTFSFIATPVDANTPVFSVPGILDITGTLVITRGSRIIGSGSVSEAHDSMIDQVVEVDEDLPPVDHLLLETLQVDGRPDAG